MGPLIFFGGLAVALGLPIWLYHRQSSEYQKQQMEQSVTIAGKNLPRISLVYIVLYSVLILGYLLEPISKITSE